MWQYAATKWEERSATVNAENIWHLLIDAKQLLVAMLLSLSNTYEATLTVLYAIKMSRAAMEKKFK